MQTTNVIGIVGLGVVGRSLCAQCVHRHRRVQIYDISPSAVATASKAYNVPSQPSVHALTQECAVLLVALPTLPTPHTEHTTRKPYDLTAFHELLDTVAELPAYQQPLLFLYSTFTPCTVDVFKTKYPHVHMFHVPEFLSSATALLDTLRPTQPTVLLGVPDNTPASVTERARRTLSSLVHPAQTVVVVRSAESEATKLFCNAFYATKVQLCNEFYTLCHQNRISYDTVRHLMLQQGWMHPMHTQVPGADGTHGFGGACLPKDLEALCLWSEQQLPSTAKQPTIQTKHTTTPTTDACAKCEVLQATRREHHAQKRNHSHRPSSPN